jgi:catechol-2,3-dioxygenase
MNVLGLSHYNLRGPRAVLDGLCSFYSQVVGLKTGARPPFRSFGYWLYAGEEAVLHLSEAAPSEVRAAGIVTTFDHVAFRCSGRRGFEDRLRALGIDYQVDGVPGTAQVQLFFQDPAGNGVELIFERTDA